MAPRSKVDLSLPLRFDSEQNDDIRVMVFDLEDEVLCRSRIQGDLGSYHRISAYGLRRTEQLSFEVTGLGPVQFFQLLLKLAHFCTKVADDRRRVRIFGFCRDFGQRLVLREEVIERRLPRQGLDRGEPLPPPKIR